MLSLGIIRTALPNMDREVKEQYQVLIQAKDMGGQLGGLAGTTTINITLSDVNDNPPRFSKSKRERERDSNRVLFAHTTRGREGGNSLLFCCCCCVYEVCFTFLHFGFIFIISVLLLPFHIMIE